MKVAPNCSRDRIIFANSEDQTSSHIYSGRRQLSFVEDDIVLFGNRITSIHTVRDFV